MPILPPPPSSSSLPYLGLTTLSFLFWVVAVIYSAVDGGGHIATFYYIIVSYVQACKLLLTLLFFIMGSE